MKIIHGTQDTTEEIGREYEIKAEEEWDVSKNQDGSVIAKWKLKDKSISISGTGNMKDESSESIILEKYVKLVKQIVIGQGITSIGEKAFSECNSLEKIEIPESVTSIGILAFEGCSSLKEIEIPESVTSIGDFAFEGCSSLKEIEIS